MPKIRRRENGSGLAPTGHPSHPLGQRRPNRRSPHRRHLKIESLEQRTLLSVASDDVLSGWNISYDLEERTFDAWNTDPDSGQEVFRTAGTVEPSSNGFTVFSFTGYTTSDPENPDTYHPYDRWFNSDSGAYEIKALETGDLLVLPPILKTETKSIVLAVDPSNPSKDFPTNWIVTHRQDNYQESQHDTYHWGTANVTANGRVQMTCQVYFIDLVIYIRTQVLN